MWMLDTNTCSYVLKHRPAAARKRFEAARPRELAISSVVLAELNYGAARLPAGAKIAKEIADFAARLEVVSWDAAAAVTYGQLRARLEKRGRLIGAMDLMIAAHALSNGSTLVTSNLREFGRVSDLPLENWVG
jgi:tRNA(fMet)-specific endonuclease VapC